MITATSDFASTGAAVADAMPGSAAIADTNGSTTDRSRETSTATTIGPVAPGPKPSATRS
jgi:hypothetical protein